MTFFFSASFSASSEPSEPFRWLFGFSSVSTSFDASNRLRSSLRRLERRVVCSSLRSWRSSLNRDRRRTRRTRRRRSAIRPTTNRATRRATVRFLAAETFLRAGAPATGTVPRGESRGELTGTERGTASSTAGFCFWFASRARGARSRARPARDRTPAETRRVAPSYEARRASSKQPHRNSCPVGTTTPACRAPSLPGAAPAPCARRAGRAGRTRSRFARKVDFFPSNPQKSRVSTYRARRSNRRAGAGLFYFFVSPRRLSPPPPRRTPGAEDGRSDARPLKPPDARAGRSRWSASGRLPERRVSPRLGSRRASACGSAAKASSRQRRTKKKRRVFFSRSSRARRGSGTSPRAGPARATEGDRGARRRPRGRRRARGPCRASPRAARATGASPARVGPRARPSARAAPRCASASRRHPRRGVARSAWSRDAARRRRRFRARASASARR